MKLKKILFSTIAIMLCIVFAAEPVLAANGTYNVNEEVHLTFGSQTPAQGGTTNKTTETDSIISEANGEINSSVQNDIIPLLTKDSDTDEYKLAPIYAIGEDRFVYVYEGNIPRTYLEKIASKVRVFIPGDQDIDNSREENDPIVPPFDDQLGFDPMQQLKDHAAEEIGPVPEDARDSAGLIENPGTWADTKVLREELRTTYHGKFVRKRIPGVPELIDFENKHDRYNALSDYLGNEIGVDPNERNSVIDTDITVLYIVEYQVVDASESMIYNLIPQDYEYNGMKFSHFIQVEKIGSLEDSGFTYKNKGENGQVEFSYTFRTPGKYNVYATQKILHVNKAMVSYSKCEYLVIAETGQIIWKQEDIGKKLDPNDPYWHNRIYVKDAESSIITKIETKEVTIRPENIGESVELSMNGTYHTIRIE